MGVSPGLCACVWDTVKCLDIKNIMNVVVQINNSHEDNEDDYSKITDHEDEEEEEDMKEEIPNEEGVLLVQFEGSTKNHKTALVKSFSIPKSITSATRRHWCTDDVKVYVTFVIIVL